jgi:hypothetical protein
MGTPFSLPPVEEEGIRWVPLAIGAGLMVLVVGAILIFGRPKPVAVAALDPYAESLVITDLKLSAAENFVGGRVNYLEGRVSNLGGKTVTSALVQCVFRNSLGEVVQREAVPLMLLTTRAGVVDVESPAAAPLTPNQTREFRLTFEHISADWDRGYPELRFIRISTK